jgi:membrane carboxypeptidase/penicillin-binding protein PbpC
MLVLKLKNLSLNFGEKILQFMVDQYNTYGASTGLTPQSRWSLVERLVRIVFQEIAKVRRKPAYITARNAKNESAEYLWACLQAHRVQQEFIEKKFVNHPAIAPLLTSHMLTIVSFKEDAKKNTDLLQKLQTNVEKQLKAVQELANKANTAAITAKEKATKALSAGPAKKKKKDQDGNGSD